MKWKKAIKVTALSVTPYLFALGCWHVEHRIGGIVAAQTPRVKDTGRVEDIIQEEARNLHLHDITINVNIAYKDDEYWSIGSYKTGDRTYNFDLPITTVVNLRESSVRHEMYHIAAGHLDEKPLPYLLEKLRYYCVWEPEAIHYEWKRNKELQKTQLTHSRQ